MIDQERNKLSHTHKSPCYEGLSQLLYNDHHGHEIFVQHYQLHLSGVGFLTRTKRIHLVGKLSTYHSLSTINVLILTISNYHWLP